MIPLPQRRSGSIAETDFRLSVDASIIRAHLNRIRSSRAFRLSTRLGGFLAFTVMKAVEGNVQDLKEYTIGIEVYGRGKDYDPKTDSIVRSEAVRLRRRLRAYYASEGAADRLRIMYPKGSYVPRFELQQDAEPGSASSECHTCNTIAVLPFVNLGVGAENQFFSDGLTEELIVALGRVPGLRVVARSSCFQFQGKAVDIREAGLVLNAAWVLEGSVRSLNGRVRVTAQLIEVATGLHLWSDVFDRQPDDLLTIQNELAYAILTALRLPGAHMAAVPDDPETHLLVVQARHFLEEVLGCGRAAKL
jgi:serine/threonine-protein kinase